MQNRRVDAGAQSRDRRLAEMAPAERVAFAVRLGAEGLADYITTHRVDRRTAVALIKPTRRLGRRRSACAEADAP